MRRAPCARRRRARGLRGARHAAVRLRLKEYAKSAAPDCDARRVLFTDVTHGTSCTLVKSYWLKPQNIFIKNHRAVIGDLGMASVSQVSKLFFLVAPSGRCDDCTYICTRGYRAPELLFGCAYGTAIDMWALGCVLAELVTGVVLFAGKSTTNQLERILHNLECEQQRVAFDDVVHTVVISAVPTTTSVVVGTASP